MANNNISNLISAALACGVDNCTFQNPIDLEKLTGEDDLLLLDELLDKGPEEFTSEQLARLQLLLNNQLECPDHGRQHLGYDSTVVVPTVIVVDLSDPAILAQFLEEEFFGPEDKAWLN